MITKPKGTYDLYGIEGKATLFLQEFISSLMEKFNYEFIRTPVFESSELFHRGVGETTDIISKETYDFIDRGDRPMTLRPEGTAGVVRSFIENKFYGDGKTPHKYWYMENMYRYDRPQKGRYREHTQFGIEVLGSYDPVVDAEVISIAVTLFRLLGLKGIKVNINSLGDHESRENYKAALLKYLRPNIDKLCPDCKERLEKNPLRIIDCKADKDNPVLKDTPHTIDYLNKESKEHFDNVIKYLEALEIDYIINPNTIRGLDYYTHTVFEIEADIKEFGAGNVMCGGGRYDNLVETLDGPSIPSVGFGLGIERLLKALEYEKIELIKDLGIDIYIQYLSEEQKPFSIALANSLRIMGFVTEIDYMNRNIKNNYKQAERLNAKFIITIGEEEIKNNNVVIKNLITKEEEKIDNMEIIHYLDEKLSTMNQCTDCNCGDECDCGDNCECEKE